MRRRFGTLLIVGAALVSLLGAQSATASSTDVSPRGSRSAPLPGTPLRSAPASLKAALSCTLDVATSNKRTVLLVHGTGATPSEDFGENLALYLPRAGYPVCQVTVPDRELNDLQGNVEYVVWAIRHIAARSHQKVDVIGHSQGAFLPSYALRFWPDLALKVGDFIGYAGTYTYGSDFANVLCLTPCSQAFQQFKPGSKLMTTVAARPLPAGPSYTAFTTALDEIVVPQPMAGTLHAPGVRNYRLQDLCPTDPAEHLTIVGEKPFLALALDALSHPGPAELSRIPNLPCGLLPEVATLGQAEGIAQFLVGSAAGESGQPAFAEPPLRCYLDPACAKPRRLPGLRASTSPGRDRSTPYTFVTRGALVLPVGATRQCSGTVRVSLRKAGRDPLVRTVEVRRDCSFVSRVTVKQRGLATVRTRFLGNTELLPAYSAQQQVRAG